MKTLFALLLTLFTLSALPATDPKAAYLMTQNGEAVIIDVREVDEIKLGMIKDAKWFPLSQVLEDKNWKEVFLKITADNKIFLHCKTGKRAERVMNILKENGISSENIGGYESLKKILPIKAPEVK